MHCAAGTEDGFDPGLGGDHACAPHDIDYAPQDWVVSLSELLRVIQFYNLKAYHACEGGEGGFCAGGRGGTEGEGGNDAPPLADFFSLNVSG